MLLPLHLIPRNPSRNQTSKMAVSLGRSVAFVFLGAVQNMATRLREARSLIDEFLPNHDFSAAYEIRINAASS
jgi:hypothetical protein